MGLPTLFTQGGFNSFSADPVEGGYAEFPPGCEGYYGWGGFGGSMMIWNPITKVSIAYTVNGNMKMSPLGLLGPRFRRIFNAINVCLLPGS